MMNKKIWTLLMAGCLSLGVAGSLKATMPVYDENIIFTDIEGHWVKPVILKLYHAGVIKGVSADKYAPQQLVTREQIVTLILKGSGKPLEKINMVTYTDVPQSRWSHQFVEAAVARGILKQNAGELKPETPVTRGEVAALVARAMPPMNLGVAGGQKPPFSDIGDLSQEMQDSIAEVYHLGIMIGDGSQLFRPNDTITRAEAASVIERMMERIQSAGEYAVNFEKVDLTKASSAIRQWVDEKKGTAGLHTVAGEGKTYILVARGEKRTGGYSIKVTKVEELPDKIRVHVSTTDPAPGNVVTQAFTFPHDLVAINQTSKPIELANAVN